MEKHQNVWPASLDQVPEERPEQPSIEVSRASISQYRASPETVLNAPTLNGAREDTDALSANGAIKDEDRLSRSSSGVAVEDLGIHRQTRKPSVRIPRSPGHVPDQPSSGYFPALWHHPSADDDYHYHLRKTGTQSSGSSRSLSANVSSSSLQGLGEGASPSFHHGNPTRPAAERVESGSSGTSTSTAIRDIRGLRRNPSHTRTGSQPLTKISSQDEEDYPQYPTQSHAVLQDRFPPLYRPRALKRQTSNPSQFSLYSDSAIPVRQLRESSTPAQMSRTTANTPASSPGLFSPNASRSSISGMDDDRFFTTQPDQLEAPRNTSSLDKSVDMYTGNKMFNEYEVLQELGRGEHGKVKLARDLKRQKQVAIKIVQRFSKQRRLGKLGGKPEEKVKKEVAILKKARHPNVVSLLEVIDDINYEKVYIILEYVDLGEIVWRKQGIKPIIEIEKRRLERERSGLVDSAEQFESDQEFVRLAELKQLELGRISAHLHTKEEGSTAKDKGKKLDLSRMRAPSIASQVPEPRAWSLEHESEPGEPDEVPDATPASRTISGYETPHASTTQGLPSTSEEVEKSPSSISSTTRFNTSLAGSMYGPYLPDVPDDRRSSVASSFISQHSDAWATDEEFSYVPCLTLSEIRSTFRDAVLGLEYLHYQGIIHRDLKPANLLWTADRRTKISDFGVSYLGRPIRDDDKNGAAEEDATEMHDPKELSRTVGTPAFYAPELCSTDITEEQPKITGIIDVWALGVTLYCMLFARVPFYDENDYAMYAKICNEPVFIPSKRLKAVEGPIPTPPGSQVPFSRSMNSNKREPFELVYETIEEDLVDLLKRLLTKDPAKRITLKDVKRHPWVLGEIQNQSAWVEDTDPSKQSAGKKIEVSAQDVAAAISKNTFIGRAMSNLKRFVGLGRTRATSSTTSVGTDPAPSTSSSSTLGKGGEGKGPGTQGNEAIYIALKASREGEHPLSQSVAASPELKEGPSYFAAGLVTNAHAASVGCTPVVTDPRSLRPDPPERAVSTTESTKTVRGLPSNLAANLVPPPNTPEPNDSISVSTLGGLLGTGLGVGRRLARGMRSRERRNDSSERASSTDRSSLPDDDAHGEPSLAVSTASASGQVNPPAALQEESPSPVGAERRSRLSSISTQPRSPQHRYDSTDEAFAHAQEQLMRRHVLEEVANKVASRPQSAASFQEECPPSPDDDIFYRQEQELQRRRQQAPGFTMQTSPPSAATISSSSDDQLTSGMSQSTSHPSIPSVVSGASSLSQGEYQIFRDQEQAQPKGTPTSTVPPMMRTGDTVKASTRNMVERADEDEEAWNGDHDDDYESEDEDEVLSFGSKTKKPIL